MNDRPLQIQPDASLTVTLTAHQWFMIQQLLTEPFRASQQLINEIQRQCLAQAERADVEMIPRRTNGSAAGEARDATV